MNRLAINELSEPVKSPFGYHLIQVLERRMQDVSDERKRLAARQTLRERKLDEAYQDWVRQIRDRAYVEYRLESIEMPALPVIAVTSGEPAGVGPELCLQLAAQKFPARLVVLADRDLMRSRAAGLALPGAYVADGADAEPGVAFAALSAQSSGAGGHLDPENADYVLALLDRALAGCRVPANFPPW